jgi:hypothetical protein
MHVLQRMILAALLIFFHTSSGEAGEKAKLGPCVRQCVHAFNPSLADSGAVEFMAEDLRARDCVKICKGTLYEGECDSGADGCCHPDFLAEDPDCLSEPLPPDPGPGNDPSPGTDQGNTLPPDPGEAGKTILAGIDSDNDGIRDDIQRYIALNYLNSHKTRAALRQLTRAIDKAMLESSSVESALRNAENMHRAIECLWYIQPDHAIKMSDALFAEYLNTYERSQAYLEYDAKLRGQVFGGKDIDEYRSSCSFDPDLMED